MTKPIRRRPVRQAESDPIPAPGWAAADEVAYDVADERTARRLAVLGAVDLLDLAVRLDVQVHAGPRPSCPNPAHQQSGRDSPVSVTVKPEGHQVWHCFGCDARGTAIDFLALATGEDHVPTLLRWLDDLADVSDPVEHTPTPRHVELDADALRPSREAEALVERVCAARGWPIDAMPPHRVVVDHGEPWLRVYADDRRNWWQNRRILEGEGPRWRSPAGRSPSLFARLLPTLAVDWVAGPDGYQRAVPAPWGRRGPVLLVEGPSDFVAACVMQRAALAVEPVWLNICAVPGASSPLVPPIEPSRLVVVADNDPAGEAMRERFPEALHVFVASPFNDLADMWAADPSPAAAAAFLREVFRADYP